MSTLAVEQENLPPALAAPAHAPRLQAAPALPLAQVPHAYVPYAIDPTQSGPHGITFDFNHGCRVAVPDAGYRVEVRDALSDYVLYRTTSKTKTLFCMHRKYFIPYGIRVWRAGEDQPVFEHRLDLKGKKVLIQYPKGQTLSQAISWFTSISRFQAQHRCELTVSMERHVSILFQDTYPHITFSPPGEIDPRVFYATYYLGMFPLDAEHNFEPIDHRHAGLRRAAAHILGVDTLEESPAIALPDSQRPIPEKYVCISTMAGTQCRFWNYPGGWLELVQFLNAHGYRVVCIDREAAREIGSMRNHIPHGCEDETGPRSLIERAHWLRHAEFFVGLASGLSWLAWAVGTPVVMISGSTLPDNEFWTPWRVINHHVCNGCWNNQSKAPDTADTMSCPSHAGTERQFECTTHITPEAVRQAIRTIPGFNTIGSTSGESLLSTR
jgi:autotransporter strand-loop-strand O-heptosyltransferase